MRSATRQLGQVALAVVALAAPAPARGEDRYYLANDDHTDYFWSADAATYREKFQDMLDFYMLQAESTAGQPSDQRGRFSTDGTLWVWEYEHNRSAADLDRLMAHVKAGDINVAMHSLVLLPGAMSTEALLRDLYYAGHLERRFGVDLEIATAMENQTLPGGVASLWAGAGARYSWKGICDCGTPVAARNRPREIYRFVGPDGDGVVMKWSSMRGGSQSIGGYAEARDPAGVVALFDSDPGFRAAWPWNVAGAFGYGWDDLAVKTDALLAASRSLSTATRRVIVSNELDFFRDFVSSHGAALTTFSGSFGNDWELGVASLARQSAEMRGLVEKLRSAEALAALVALGDPSFLDGRAAARDLAFQRMGLYYEHDFTNGGPGASGASRLGFQNECLALVHAYVDPLFADALAALADQVATPRGVQRYLVVNPLSFSRTDVALLPAGPAGAMHVVDVTTGNEVPSQPALDDDGTPRLAILARDVPSLGYRVYEMRPGAGATFPAAATVSGATVDNGRYRVTLAGNGALSSLVDHGAGDRELVTAGGGLNRLGATGGTVTVAATGPVMTTLTTTATGSPARTVRVTLYAPEVDRVDVDDRITQGMSGTVTYRWDLGLGAFTARHEELGMIARIARAGAGGDYADQNTRTDFLTLNHFIDLSEAGFGATLSSRDDGFMRLGDSTVDTLDTATPRLETLVGSDRLVPGVFPAQAGEKTFRSRYAVRTHAAYEQPAAMRFALAHQNPLAAARVTGGVGTLPADHHSLLAIASPDILLWALKPAEEGIAAGLIARVWNLSDSPRSLDLTLPGATLRSARRTTHLETDLEGATVSDGHLTAALARQQLRTFRLSADTLPPLPDAGPAPSPDAVALASDAGPLPGGDRGCGCCCRVGRRLPSELPSGLPAAADLALVVAFALTRRRRR